MAQITEPMTMITDYILTIFGLFLAVRLLLTVTGALDPVAMIAYAIVSTSVGAFFGGTSHGFKEFLGERFNQLSWLATVYTIGVGSFFLLVGTILVTPLSPLFVHLLVILATVKLFIYLIWITNHTEFIYVISDYVPSMIVALLLFVYNWILTGIGAAPWIISGIVVSFIAAAVQALKIGFHEHFNHNDLFHVIQLGGLYLLYRGALLL